ncbi:MAG: hypothetical protein WC044_10265 [Crocinitomicaceae bacterium]
MKTILILFSTLFLFGSCIEIIDDISINADGSGTFKYNVNLSGSKVKLNSVLALDSLDGKKVPSRSEILARIDHFKTVFESKEGISEVNIESDLDNYIVKLSCNFKNVHALQEAFSETILEEMKESKTTLENKGDWISWNGDVLSRSIPELTVKKAKELKPDEVDLLKQGNYISITRFNRPVKEFSNENAVLAKNKLAVMLKTNAYSLSQNPSLLENTIYLSPLKP